MIKRQRKQPSNDGGVVLKEWKPDAGKETGRKLQGGYAKEE